MMSKYLKHFILSGILLIGSALFVTACNKAYSLAPVPVPATATNTFTYTPTRTFTPTITNTIPGFTATNTVTSTFTSTYTVTSTSTATRTPTNSATPTNTFTSTVTYTPIPAVVSTLAGSAAVTGATNGTGSAASFNWPEDVTYSTAGNALYVADTGNDMIRGLSTAGVVWTVAGSAGVTGATNASGATARFNSPGGVVCDAAGEIFVADTGNNMVRKIDLGGNVTTFAGNGTQGHYDGTGTLATFYFPYGIAIDASGNLYIGDVGNAKIRMITPAGVVSTIAGSGAIGDANGPALSSTFDFPYGVAVDSSGNVYEADYWPDLIREVSGGTVSTLTGTGSTGTADGPIATASFYDPVGIFWNTSGNIYVSDSWGEKIRVITTAGTVETVAGTGAQGAADGPGISATFNNPSGLTMDGSGDIFVADRLNNEIRKIAP